MSPVSLATAPGSPVPFLHRISTIVSSDLSVDEMLGHVVGLTVEVCGCDACLVYLLDTGTRELVLHASQMPHGREFGNVRMKVGEGITGWVAKHKSVVILPSRAEDDPRFKRVKPLVEDTYEAFMSVPMMSAGEVVGVINVHHRLPHQHTPEEIALVKFVGEQMGAAVAKSQLLEERARLREQTLAFRHTLDTAGITDQHLWPESAVRQSGTGPVIDTAGFRRKQILITLEITCVVEYEGLSVSIWGSPDKLDWGAKPLASLAEKRYCGTYTVVLDLAKTPEIGYLRAQWIARRWAVKDPEPLFYFSIRAEETGA